jgi:hypothetical protein
MGLATTVTAFAVPDVEAAPGPAAEERRDP